MKELIETLSAHPFIASGSIWFVLGGFAFGVLSAAVYFLTHRQKLVARVAELTAQIKAEKLALETAGAVLDSRFRATAGAVLKDSQERLAEQLSSSHKDSAHDLDKRQRAIDDLVKPVQENLKALAGALEQVKGTDQHLRQEIHMLNRETARLVGALRDPSAQGQWGEYILEGVLDKSGLIKGVHYDTQVTLKSAEGRQRPDAIIRMQDGFNIIVDSKAPLNEFARRMGEDLHEDEHRALMGNLARQVREHVKILGQKAYWDNDLETADFTVMFLPSEHLYSLALRADPDLVEFAAAKNVIIASPTLLMSLLRVVGMSWRQVELAQNAQEISALGADLYKRFLKFTDHLEKIGKNLQNAMSGYDAAVGSMERQVLPAARKFKDLQSAQAGMAESDLPRFKPITEAPRLVSLASEDEAEKKRA